jgi:hypothetical protein
LKNGFGFGTWSESIRKGVDDQLGRAGELEKGKSTSLRGKGPLKTKRRTLQSDQTPSIEPLPLDLIPFRDALVPGIHLLPDPLQILLSPPCVRYDIPSLSSLLVLPILSSSELSKHEIVDDTPLLVEQHAQRRAPLLELAQRRGSKAREERSRRRTRKEMLDHMAHVEQSCMGPHPIMRGERVLRESRV